MLVVIDTRPITDSASFHQVFVDALGFPGFYGQNMNAWIDCLSYLDAPESGMTTVHVEPGEVLALQIDHVRDFAARCPEQYRDLVECAAFVNWRRTSQGEPPLIALSFYL